ncbi:MAG: ABC transporter permease [Oscillospiraceae bacterium]|nr:ABC transporter permease [Oscillospiraceae bacterium]
MRNLIKFELRKILTKRFAVVSVAAVLLLSFILSFSTFQSMHAFDGESREGNGKTAVEIDKAVTAKYEGVLTDEKVQQIMSEFKPTHDLHGMNAKYLYQNALQSAAFTCFSDTNGDWNGLSVTDVFGNEEIKVGYVNGWLSTSQNIAKVLIFLSFVIVLLISPVFSGEYSGVDNIILTSRYGKTKCATAKVIASLLSAVLITIFVLSFNLIFSRIAYGSEGLDCSILFAPMDFSEGYIPFNITCGTVLKYQLLLAFMSAISVTGVTLLLSAVCKNQMIAFVASAAIYVIPIMLPVSETNALYRLIVLMPLYYSQYISIMSVDQMSNGLLYAIWAVPTALVLIVIGGTASRRIFAKHQVS